MRAAGYFSLMRTLAGHQLYDPGRADAADQSPGKKSPSRRFWSGPGIFAEQSGISTILVVGSSGSYLHIADVILQMDNGQPFDITAKVKEVLKNHPAPVTRAPGYRLPEGKRQLHLGASTAQRKSYRGDKVMTERLKVKTMGKDVINIGKETLDLRHMEQLVDRDRWRRWRICCAMPRNTTRIGISTAWYGR